MVRRAGRKRLALPFVSAAAFALSGLCALSACLLDFPTLTTSVEAGVIDVPDGTPPTIDGSTLDGTIPPRFCTGGSTPPTCEDFDDEAGGYTQDGAPVIGTNMCAPFVVGDLFLSPPSSMNPRTTKGTNGCDVYLGYVVPVNTMKTIEVTAAFNIATPEMASTPHPILKLTTPGNETFLLAYDKTGLSANANGAIEMLGAQVSTDWFTIVLDMRLGDRTFSLSVNGVSIMANGKGVGEYPADAAAPADAGPQHVTFLFGTTRPVGEPDVTIHIDNIRITSD